MAPYGRLFFSLSFDEHKSAIYVTTTKRSAPDFVYPQTSEHKPAREWTAVAEAVTTLAHGPTTGVECCES